MAINRFGGDAQFAGYLCVAFARVDAFDYLLVLDDLLEAIQIKRPVTQQADEPQQVAVALEAFA